MDYSPALSLATFGFEVAAAVWIAMGRGRPRIKRLLVALLLLLAGYQLMEWLVCASPGNLLLARVAFADIVWLPSVGTLLVATLAGPKSKVLRWTAYGFLGISAGLAVAVLVVPGFISMTVCQAVFATYHTDAGTVYKVYGAFYDIALATMVFGGVAVMPRVASEHDRRLLGDFMVGSLGFILPALATLVAVASTRGALPSILCHYALFLAVSLVTMGWRERRASEDMDERSPSAA